MKIKYLLKFSIIMVVMVLLFYLVLSIISYFADTGKAMNYIFIATLPVSIFVAGFFYSMKCGEKGLFRGLEIWAVYFLIVVFLKIVVFESTDINLVKHLLFMPVGIVAGVLGVNFHK